MPRVDIGDIHLHYQQAGAGPDVIVLHALTSNLAIWFLTGAIQRLSNGFKVTAYDLRGHGMSDMTVRGYTSKAMAVDLLKLHERLGLGTVLVVGHSFGGLVALHAAAMRPEVVAGVIMSDTYVPALAHLDQEDEKDGLWLELKQVMAHAGKEIGEKRDFQRLFDAAADLTPEEADIIKSNIDIPCGGWLEQLAQLAGTKASREAFEVAGLTPERISMIEQPVVAMYDQRTEFPHTCAFLLSNLKDCRRIALPTARHLAPLECSEAFVETVRLTLLELGEETRHAHREI